MPETETSPHDVYVYNYHGDADQDFGDPDVMVVSVVAATPEAAMEIARCERHADWEAGEQDEEFVGYVEKDEVPKGALTIGNTA